MSRFTFILTLLLTFHLAYLSLQQSSPPPSLVISIIRHGARGPLLEAYDNTWDPSLVNELTPVGMRQLYLLGKALAEKYPTILGEPYNRSKIHVGAGEAPRTFDSAISLLYGIYQGNGPALNPNPSYPADRAVPPFNASQIEALSEGLNNSEAIPGGFVPVTVEREGNPLDVLNQCIEVLDDAVENALSEKSRNFWNVNLASARQYLEANNFTFVSPVGLGLFGDTLICDYFEGKELPAGIDPESDVYRDVTFARDWYFTLAFYSSEQQKQLNSIPLFDYIVTQLDLKASGNSSYEFIILSAYDITLLNILPALGIVTEECLMDNYIAQVAGNEVPYPNCLFPAFAANVLLEFYDNNGSPYVIFRYNDVVIPICQDKLECPYDEFKNLVNRITRGMTLEEQRDECNVVSAADFEELFVRFEEAFTGRYFDGSRLENLTDIINQIF